MIKTIGDNKEGMNKKYISLTYSYSYNLPIYLHVESILSVIIFVDQKKISIEFCSSSDKTDPDVSTTNVTDNSTTNVSRVNNFVRQVRN